METKLIQITSGRGPEECERVVYLVFEKIRKQARTKNLEIEVVDLTEGKQDKTYLSILFKLKGSALPEFCHEWEGTLQWVAQSPFRKSHKRKNWFVGIIVHDLPEKTYWNEKEIVFQTLRASGPGGQNVNKVESAVRATHVPTGASVTASDERSQLMNKKTAEVRLRNKLLSIQLEDGMRKEQERWMEHTLLERGNALKVIKEAL